MRPDRTITRPDLVRIVDEATTHVVASTRAKLLDVAATTDAVAVGWFYCDGVQCPARQARRTNQTFQRAYDAAMYDYFGATAEDIFVVRVVDGASGKESRA